MPALLLSTVVQGTLVDKSKVGPLTALSAKSKICNVLNYGAIADNKTDRKLTVLTPWQNMNAP